MKTGQLIKELRLKRGITQEELAAKTEISTRTIQRIENCEVDPRAFTLQSIAAALEVDYETLAMTDDEMPISNNNTSAKWLPLLHLSGLLLTIILPIILWILKRNELEGIRNHGVDVINYQLSMSLYLLPLALLGVYPIFIILFVYSQVVIVMNTVKVTSGQEYKYPLNIKFIKSPEKEKLIVA